MSNDNNYDDDALTNAIHPVRASKVLNATSPAFLKHYGPHLVFTDRLSCHVLHRIQNFFGWQLKERIKRTL